MTGILADIVAYKREFVAARKRELPQRELEAMAFDSSPPGDFTGVLREDGCRLIAEVKTASPSKGVIRDDIDPLDVAELYAENGAACISVLTDERYFRGSLGRLMRIRERVSLPLLRKDFIIDPYQVYEARYAGADAILLIAACLDDNVLRDLMETAALMDLQCLVEVHNEAEMERVAVMSAGLIGINNRDLTTFATDLGVTAQLAALAPEEAVLVSESGIHTAGDVRTIHRAGAKAVLVGEAIMRSGDIAAKVRELAGAATTDVIR